MRKLSTVEVLCGSVPLLVALTTITLALSWDGLELGNAGEWFAGVAAVAAIVLLLYHRAEDEQVTAESTYAGIVGHCNSILAVVGKGGFGLIQNSQLLPKVVESLGEIGRLLTEARLQESEVAATYYEIIDGDEHIWHSGWEYLREPVIAMRNTARKATSR